MTPIQRWPERQFRGSPGYSARHYASLSGAAEDPLRVAARIVSAENHERVREEAAARMAAGERFEATLAWQARELAGSDRQQWEELCGSIAMVVAALERAPSTPAMKRLLREARKAAAG